MSDKCGQLTVALGGTAFLMVLFAGAFIVGRFL